eukprot:TRINITY_DN1853_c1_g1_i8.p1 TRINITY_DN1853_c1_g1~~TRINITY_DN1853_c1_g1_i8.p1  ORF type:complete len:1398 (-),score=301.30 TRINITY_DN1853_c1_g1_i8:101-4294(-)
MAATSFSMLWWISALGVMNPLAWASAPTSGPTSSPTSAIEECDEKANLLCYTTEWECLPKMFYEKCPCKPTEQECFSYSYNTDEAGTVFRELGKDGLPTFTTSCVADGMSCPCDATYEKECEVPFAPGGKECYMNEEECPVFCENNEQLCMNFTYSASGMINMTAPATQFCESANESCPCNDEYENTCTDDIGSFCLPKMAGECPTVCTDKEVYCYQVVYTADGQPNYSAPLKESCAEASLGCPCDPNWEVTCTLKTPMGSEKYCTSSRIGCPLTCDIKTCYSRVYKSDGSVEMDAFGGVKIQASCSDAKGVCACDAANELECTNLWGEKECLPKSEVSACPVMCGTNEFLAFEDSFSATGQLMVKEKCVTDWYEQFGMCGTGARQCRFGPGPEDLECIWDRYQCPLICTVGEKMCNVEAFDVLGKVKGFSEVCVLATEECPCGENALKQPCSFVGEGLNFTYCVWDQDKCPVQCDFSTNKMCIDADFSASGSLMMTATSSVCSPAADPCPCNGTNSRQCSMTFGSMTETWCQPAAMDGVVNPCPVQCDMATQDVCLKLNFDVFGRVSGSMETCVPKGQNCGCGKNAIECTEGGMSYCLPRVNPDTTKENTCPLVCDADFKMCTVPSFTPLGDITSFMEYCGNATLPCDCSKGVGSKACTTTFNGMSYTECIPIAAYCPASCAAGEVTCPEMANYKADGSIFSVTAPPAAKACAASYADCPCGQMARNCTDTALGYSWCQPSSMACPLECAPTDKSCWVTSYDANGGVLSEKERCVPKMKPCPCGKGSTRCPGTDICLPEKEAKLVCPCKPIESECTVENYDMTGKQTDLSILCVPKGARCPCGKNTMTCESKLEQGKFTCQPKVSMDGKASCPSPCSPGEEAMNKSTCVVTNLNNKGNFMSEQVMCTPRLGKCPLGAGQIKCPTGATIMAGIRCQDPYGLLAKMKNKKMRRLEAVEDDFEDGFEDGSERRLSLAVGEMQTSTVVFFMKDVAKSQNALAGETKSVKAAVDSVLFVSTPLTSTLTIQKATGSMEASMVYKVTNAGATNVLPSQVASNLKMMVTTSDASLATATNAVGKVNANKGATVTTTTQRATVRGETPIPTPAPTPGPNITVRPTRAPTPAPTMAALNNSTTITTTTTTTFPTGPVTEFRLLVPLNSPADYDELAFRQGLASVAGVDLINVQFETTRFEVQVTYEVFRGIELANVKDGISQIVDIPKKDLLLSNPTDEGRRLQEDYDDGIDQALIVATMLTHDIGNATNVFNSVKKTDKMQTIIASLSDMENPADLGMGVTVDPALSVQISVQYVSSSRGEVPQPSSSEIMEGLQQATGKSFGVQVGGKNANLLSQVTVVDGTAGNAAAAGLGDADDYEESGSPPTVLNVAVVMLLSMLALDRHQ